MNLKDAGIYDLVNIFKGEPTPSHKASQGGIINNTQRVINIPAYQRPYRWGEENINQLFLDYDENSAEYFLGSAVVVEKLKADGSIEFDVVDGQQRITTLYLLNYIRFLLKREYVLEKISKPYQFKSSQYCNELRAYYVDLIGKNAQPFDHIQKKIDELTEDEQLDAEERVKQLIECYKSELCIPENKSTPQATLAEKLAKAHSFFDDEQLCLKYSRRRYDTVLRDALCIVYLKPVENTNKLDLGVITETKDDPFTVNYLNALRTIFNNVWERASRKVDPDAAGMMDICEEAILLLDEIIKNMSLCIVLTENENDANKLFEVLNDRSLDVEDLELIKNHFYKEYCTKSNDSEEDKDKRITELDELWGDKIFCNNAEARNRLISYFAAVYLTCDTELVYKDDTKLKTAIEKGYSSKQRTYTYQDILADFNVYYAIKIILDKFDVKTKKVAEIALEAEQGQNSITYKTVHLLNASKYNAVLPALINVIISTYTQIPDNTLIDTAFENKFKSFIDGLISDNNHVNEQYTKIHRCAYMLWVATLKAKDHSIPRSIAKRIIAKYGKVGYSSDNMDFEGSEISSLNEQFNQWLDTWTYSNGKDLAVKIIMLNLLLSERTPTSSNYQSSQVVLNLHSALTYKLDAGRLQLDHLEAKNINPSNTSAYYLSHDTEKRQKDVNGYLGNFMILDAIENNIKNNVPMKDALPFYASIEKSWLIQDIKSMMQDIAYFDSVTSIPKEAFFTFRSKQLKKYFKALLNRQLDQQQITVELD